MVYGRNDHFSEARTPHPFVDVVKNKLGLRFDYALSEYLGFNLRHITLVRGGYRVISDELLLAAHEATEIPIKTLKTLIPPDQVPVAIGIRGRGEP